MSCIDSFAESILVLPLQEPAEDERMQQAETLDTLANLGRFGDFWGDDDPTIFQQYMISKSSGIFTDL